MSYTIDPVVVIFNGKLHSVLERYFSEYLGRLGGKNWD